MTRWRFVASSLVCSIACPLAWSACSSAKTSESVYEPTTESPATTQPADSPNGFSSSSGEAPTLVEAGPTNGPRCGDGRIDVVAKSDGGSASEACDDGNGIVGDGCDDRCRIEAGYVCPVAGATCVAARCGDGILAGTEECDDANGASGDGCSGTCAVENGFACDPLAPSACRKTTCGDGVREGTEQCDDGNKRPYDGCGVACDREPSCTGGSCTGVCGDGIVFPGEACDDGNSRSGDGCSATCALEPGFSCVADASPDPDDLAIPVLYRDLKDAHPDFETYVGRGETTGLVQNRLAADGRPEFASTTGSNRFGKQLTGAPEFFSWFRDSADNKVVVDALTLRRASDSAGNVLYVFDSSSFFPLDGYDSATWGKQGRPHNFHFTSELRHWFTYNGGETLEFRGDDDVWVFINGTLAVDLGGTHPATLGSVTLDVAKATALGLTVGGMYEIALFQAERHTPQSNYKLTLRGFSKRRTVCASICGDGIKTRDEACDDGSNNGRGYGYCAADCRSRGAYCGDGTVNADNGEQCDTRGATDTCTADCRVRATPR